MHRTTAFINTNACGSMIRIRANATTKTTIQNPVRLLSAAGTVTTDSGSNIISRQEEVRRVAHERLAGRRRFYKVVDVVTMAGGSNNQSNNDDQQIYMDHSPISAGVDGTDSGSGILTRPTSISKVKASFIHNCLDDNNNSCVKNYGVTLDNKLIKTPVGQSFEVPSLALAMAVAAEWDTQRTFINPAQMPLMTLSCTAMDQTAFDPETTIQNILQVSKKFT